MAVLDFKRSTTTPSTLAKGTLQFVKVGSRFKMLVGDNANSPTEANYLPFEGGTLTGGLTLDTNIASPLILTRTGDVGINMNGSYLGVSGGVLRFGTSTTHANNDLVWTSGNLTQASINGWNAAYGWGDHAGKYSSRGGQSITGLSGHYNSIRTKDERAIDETPSTRANGVWFDFKQSSAIGFAGGSTYASLISMLPYSDGSGNNNAGFRLAQSGGVLQFQHAVNDSTWASWREIYHTGSPRITAPIIDATAALIIPNTAPTAPEANRTYLWIS